MKLWSFLLAVFMVLASVSAEAARFGGGRSFGRQSSNVTQRQVAPARAPAPATAPGATAPKRPWGAMFGGLAAGLGLAWLASSLGLGAEFGQLILFGLLALAVMMAIGWFKRSSQAQAAQRRPGQPGVTPYAFDGLKPVDAQPVPTAYRPENVGNDASARPWERITSFDALNGASSASGSMIGSALSGTQTWGIPAGFDSAGFVTSAKANFVTLQAAWDRADFEALRLMTTDAMLTEIRSQLAERDALSARPSNLTEVLMVEAHLLGIEDTGTDYMASVEFSGMIREEPSAGASPFREVWNMTKSKNDGSGWLVAGVQALQ